MSWSVLGANMSRSDGTKVSCQRFDAKGFCEKSNCDQSKLGSRKPCSALDVGVWWVSLRVGRFMCVWRGGKYGLLGKGGEGCLVLGVGEACCIPMAFVPVVSIPVMFVPVGGNGCPGLGVASSCCVLGVRIASPTVDTFSRFE